MAAILSNGLVQFADGRILYSDTSISGQDFMELQALLPQINPIIGRAAMVGFPFVSGGGGGSGTPGARGVDGTPGTQGLTGVEGQTGPQGATGLGVTGPQGTTGPSGGPPGATGVQGTQGATGTQGTTGVGAQGQTGVQGITGPGAGLQGVTGVQGTTGPSGGPVGATGIQGTTGVQGSTGAGAQGQTGTQGATGPTGASTQNAIIQAQVVGTNADFLSVAGLNATLIGNAGNPFVYDINGTVHMVTSNVVLPVTNNANNFIWIDDTMALGSSAFPCIYSVAVPGAPATDQHWFDLGHNQMMRWNGAAFVPVNRLFIGYVRADAGTIAARYACEPLDLTPIDRFSVLGTGADGFLELTAGTTTINGLKQYTAIVLRGTAVLIHTTSADTQLELLTQGIAIMLGTASINLTGRGLSGGPNGVSTTGQPGASGGLGGAGGGGGNTLANPTGNGGGRITLTSATAVGGGSPGNPGTNGLNSTLGTSVPKRQVYFCYGNGGGSGSGGTPANAGAGGAGGGAVTLTSSAIALATTATIHCDGASGAGGFAPNTGGGGGGGGIAQLISRSLFNNGTITFAGGPGAGQFGGVILAGDGGIGALITITI